MLKEKYKESTNHLYKKLILIPWLYEKNNNITEDIFNEVISNNKDEEYKKLLYSYFNYFKCEWEPFLKDGRLNFSNVSKIQRSNSFIENYNRYIKDCLRPYESKKGMTKLSWPMFKGFIVDEENKNKSEIINLLNKKNLIM